jgi:hypothetical protein
VQEIARAEGSSRLRGEEVRLSDVPATEPGASGIFDQLPASVRREDFASTTKRWAENLKRQAERHQGHALLRFLHRYLTDSSGLKRLKAYKMEFETKTNIGRSDYAYARIQTNFAVVYAAAALAIDYKVVPWSKKATFEAIEKCLRLALGELDRPATTPPVPAAQATRANAAATLNERLKRAVLITINGKEEVTDKQIAERQAADGFAIGNAIYVKPGVMQTWLPPADIRELIDVKAIRTRRSDTPTTERKIRGIAGKRRYFDVDIQQLQHLTSSATSGLP